MSKQEKDDAPWKGDAWLWVGIDPSSKAIISWLTGKRTAQAARTFCHDLAARVPGNLQVTSDPLAAYKFALLGAFGDRLDYATETKPICQFQSPIARVAEVSCRPFSRG